ncbi:phosphoserine phosphatase SerB [Enterovirga rhinocerotis]|uniref:Phosphoserine phosphatase n=1 Tax=Enterovirga rhinocerotis TaxID=1339210 RepID=A0A4V3DZ84_9HYPH|nr:phosphoserine phosphatase SerB [Enterovirga rhinocerotis]TDR94979.1 phosphoserine phosphatase [Enterovirga rhinocerotis]
MADSPSLIATLIANPDRPTLDAGLLRRAGDALGIGTPRILAEGIAAEFETAGAPSDIERHLRAAIADAPVDIAVQPAGSRRKRLFLADMDSTMIGQECIDELADFVGLKPQVSAITERAMRGEIAFEPALRERVALLKGLSTGIVEGIIRERITLTPGGRELVATMKRDGAHTCLVSGGFTLFTGPIAAMIGFDENRANVLLTEGDELVGHVAEPILGREAKLATLIELRDTLGLRPEDVLAVGDGANDLAMLGEAAPGVAFRAKPAVAAAAHIRIDHADLTALLYLQGYRRDEFAA